MLYTRADILPCHQTRLSLYTWWPSCWSIRLLTDGNDWPITGATLRLPSKSTRSELDHLSISHGMIDWPTQYRIMIYQGCSNISKFTSEDYTNQVLESGNLEYKPVRRKCKENIQEQNPIFCWLKILFQRSRNSVMVFILKTNRHHCKCKVFTNGCAPLSMRVHLFQYKTQCSCLNFCNR